MFVKTHAPRAYSILLSLLLANSCVDTALASAQEAIAKPSFLGLTDAGWVAIAMVLFIFVAWRAGAFKSLTQSLDSQIAKIKAQLEEAEQLRKDALELKRSYEKRQAEAEALAANIVTQAEQEAARMIESAQEQVRLLTQRRTQAVEARIDAVERAAIAELRHMATQLGATAATRLLETSVSSAAKGQLIDQAIAELDNRLH